MADQTEKKVEKIVDSIPETPKHDENRMDFKPFFKSMFSTFGITLLLFMGLLFLLFVIQLIRN